MHVLHTFLAALCECVCVWIVSWASHDKMARLSLCGDVGSCCNGFSSDSHRPGGFKQLTRLSTLAAKNDPTPPRWVFCQSHITVLKAGCVWTEDSLMTSNSPCGKRLFHGFNSSANYIKSLSVDQLPWADGVLSHDCDNDFLTMETPERASWFYSGWTKWWKQE